MASSKKSQPAQPAPDAGAADGQKFEEALARLEEIVEAMAEGDLPLEQSLAAYKEGIALVKFCQARLKEVEQEILKIAPGPDGEPLTAPFDDDEA